MKSLTFGRMNFQGNLSLDHEASENENAFLVDSQPARAWGSCWDFFVLFLQKLGEAGSLDDVVDQGPQVPRHDVLLL